MVTITVTQLLWAAGIIVGAFCLYLLSFIPTAIEKKKAAKNAAKMLEESKMAANLKSQIADALFNRWQMFDVDSEGSPTCPKCERWTHIREPLWKHGWDLHWWYCKCRHGDCGHTWVMACKDDLYHDIEQEVTRLQLPKDSPLRSLIPTVSRTSIIKPGWEHSCSCGHVFQWQSKPSKIGVKCPRCNEMHMMHMT